MKTLKQTTLLLLIIVLMIGWFAFVPKASAGFIIKLPTSLGLTSSLQGHWAFDGGDISGTTVTDKSGQGNNGTIVNNGPPIMGKIGQALDFDGVNARVDTADIDITEYLTIAGWVKLDTLYSPDLTMEVIGKSSVYGITLSSAGGGGEQRCVLATASKGWNYCGTDGTNPITANTWHHVALTYASSTGYIHFLDGQDNGGGSDYTGLIDTNDEVVTIGSRSTGRYLDGQIDDVRIYNRALSEGEIRRLYNMGGGVKVNYLKNNFSGDANAKLHFRFEPGLLEREELTNNDSFLTAIATPVENTTDQFEGSGAADFEYWDGDGYSVTDALFFINPKGLIGILMAHL
jgi:hypothetical protein